MLCIRAVKDVWKPIFQIFRFSNTTFLINDEAYRLNLRLVDYPQHVYVFHCVFQNWKLQKITVIEVTFKSGFDICKAIAYLRSLL